MKGYFKYTTQLISSKGRFFYAVLGEHPLPHTAHYTIVCRQSIRVNSYRFHSHRGLMQSNSKFNENIGKVCYKRLYHFIRTQMQNLTIISL